MLKASTKSLPHVSGNLLIVDDAPSILIILKSFLQDDRCRLFPAENGVKALKILEEQPIDLVLLDVMMPEMGGYEVCRKMRLDPRFRDIPVIFLTGLARKEEIVRGLEVGGSDYLVKPFDREELILRVRQHLHSYTIQRRLQRLASEQKTFSHALNEELKRQTMRWEPIQQQLTEISSEPVDEGELVALQRFFKNVRQWGELLAGNDATMRSMLNLSQEIDWSQWRDLLESKCITLNFVGERDDEIFADIRMVNLLLGQVLPWVVELAEAGSLVQVVTTPAVDAMQIEICWSASEDKLDAVPDLRDLELSAPNGDTSGMPLRLCSIILKRHFGDVTLVREDTNKARLSLNFPNT
ncbi:response regulator [Cerasicoccus maritimus]|uniref:response regulator n=1 Tax=Cerasicoccus maritimus TaxID=490089 RepID=UPI0028526808|nr:response regulator [Cerasicoccus maritimus]